VHTRDGDTLTLELRYDTDAPEYVATTIGFDPETTRFKSGERLRHGSARFERDMRAASWTPGGPPHILPLDWLQRSDR